MPPKKPIVAKATGKASTKLAPGKGAVKKSTKTTVAGSGTTGGKSTKGSVPGGSKVAASTSAPKKWTKQDDAARKIQTAVRKLLARRAVEKKRKDKEEYEATIERLEREAYVMMARKQQEEAEREREKKEEELRARREDAKRRKRMLEAAFDGDDDAVLAIIDEVSRLDDKNKVGDDVIGRTTRGRHIVAVVECEDANGNTPLSEAASGGQPSTVRLFLERGADPNSRGQFRRTPLFRAAFAGHLEACQVLLENGADPRLYSEDAQTPEQVASLDGVAALLRDWDIGETERLLVKLASDREQRALAAREGRKAEEGKLENLVQTAQDDYRIMEKQYCKASEEANKRISEHDSAAAEGFSKPDVTLQAIHDAEAQLELKKMALEKARDALQLAKLRLREQQSEQKEAAGEKEDVPGIKVNIRELDDVLLRDVGNRIADSKKSPLIIDSSSRAATFLRYRDTNYMNVLNQEQMTAQKIRLCLLGAVRFGKPVVLDMMQVDMYESCSTRFNEVEQGLFESLLDQSFICEKKYLKLIRDKDGDQYSKNSFNDSMASKFRFCVVTSSPYPNDELLAKMYPIRVVI